MTETRSYTKNLIQMHINPIKNLDLSGKKGLIPTHTKEESDATHKALNLMKEFLSSTRVDRKHSRSEAVWLPDKRLSRLTRRAGKTQSNFGFMENGETYLNPEESLYLLETNYLELLWNEVPFSIEQAYSVLLTSKESIDKYRTFKELTILGYRVQNPEISPKRKSQRADSSEAESKKTKSSRDAENNLFERLKEEGPRTAKISENYSTLYNVFLPKNSIKNSTPDFELIKTPDTSHFSLESTSGIKSNTVTSFSGNESVSFYQFHEVDLENK